MILSYYAARANLYHLWQLHPEWEHAALAAAIGSSKGWVKKWLKRFREELASIVRKTIGIERINIWSRPAQIAVVSHIQRSAGVDEVGDEEVGIELFLGRQVGVGRSNPGRPG